MKKVVTIIALLATFIAGLFIFFNPMAWVFAPRDMQEPVATTTPATSTVDRSNSAASTESVQTVARNLSVPWGLAFLPNGNLLVTERTGRLKELDAEGNVVNQQDITGVTPRGEGGLLGLALHPDFADNRHLYLYETYESDQGTRN